MKKLKELLVGINCKVYGQIKDVLVDNISHDSRDIAEGSLFIALSGSKDYGGKYASEAQERGAVAIVSETFIDSVNLPIILVDNARLAYAKMASNFYENPSDKLVCIGVIGTNGKTTCTKIIGDCLTKMGVKSATIGTLGCYIGAEKHVTNMTTPDPSMLYKLLAEMVNCGVTHVVMEVSAHAIYLSKVEGINFRSLLYTNITQDHLDYFHDMDTYSNVKLNFFRHHGENCIVNIDDDYSDKLLSITRSKVITYSLLSSADLIATNIKNNEDGQEFLLEHQSKLIDVKTRLNGRFNVYNLLGAIGVMLSLKFEMEDIIRAIECQLSAEGRFNMVYDKGVRYVIDYAHTPDGLSKILTECKNIAGKNRLIVVFGCGGERDAEKRPIMGRIASEIADITIVTEDNSRSENRQDIIDSIVNGIRDSKAKIFVCPDRKIAIAQSIKIANCGDVVVLAGKGAENYIEKNNKKFVHNDKRVLVELLNGNN